MSKSALLQDLDVVLAGLAVVDVIGRPMQFDNLPERGALQLVDSVTLTTGGNVANCAIDLAKLGLRAGAITRVGRDGLGDFVQSELRRHGVEASGIIVDPTQQTSATIVAVGKDGERSFLHTRGCLRNFRVSDILEHLSLVRRGRIFAFGYFGLLPECDRGLKRLFRTIKEKTTALVLVDTGGTPHRDSSVLRGFLPYVDYFIPSYDEAVVLTGKRSPEAIIRYLVDGGAKGVVGVKLGSRGCYIESGGEARLIPPIRVRTVVDATGAGDAFVAGFLAGILRGFNPFASAAIGNAVASRCITSVGASTAIGRLEEYVRPRPDAARGKPTRQRR